MLKWLISIVYGIFTRVYPWLVKLVSFNNDKAKAWIKGRQNQQAFIDKISKWSKGNTIWVHAASSGEYQQVLPIMKAYKTRLPEARFVLTFFSPSGYEQWKENSIADAVGYLPWEASKDLNKFIHTIQPACVWIVKNEFWFRFLKKLQKESIPTIFISTYVKAKSHIFYPYFKDIIKKVDHFFVQDETSSINLKAQGINQTTVSGDSRIDHVITLSDKSIQIPRLESLKNPKSKFFVYGSIYIEDIQIIQSFISNHPNDVHILVPHNVSKENVYKIIKKLKKPVTKYSEGTVLKSPVIINTVGILNEIYQLADCVYIGGGFNHGIHNTLEPAVFGIPVLFGPKYQKFPEACEFINIGVAKSVKSPLEFSISVGQLLNNKDAIQSHLEIFFNKHKGATEKVLNTMIKLELCQH